MFGVPVPNDMICVATTGDKNFRAVTWSGPTRLRGFKTMSDLIIDIVKRVNGCRSTPNWNTKPPGCKSCNDIMTQAATSSDFLVRKTLTTPLVPEKRILSIALNGKDHSDFSFKATRTAGNVRCDPNESNSSGVPSAFTYQACLAYYVHRCMPVRTDIRSLNNE
jgi:hypothetical protein